MIKRMIMLRTGFGPVVAAAAILLASAPGALSAVGTKDRQPRTLYGFFPSPPELTLESVFEHYGILGKHSDAVLYQTEIPWEEFLNSPDAESKKIEDLSNQRILAGRERLECIYVVDPLNGLDRREFMGLPEGWTPSFADPRIRAAYRNFTIRILREFEPAYLGLASEINSYADAYPEDFPHFLSLYRETYEAVKVESPETQVFATFQWEDLNDLWNQPEEGVLAPGTTKWEQIEIFEPQLDVWAVSSYPYTAFENSGDIPENYYSRLLERTDKPLAVSEGGWISEDYRHLSAAPRDQTAYLEAIHGQIGERLAFWIYLLARDIDAESYRTIIDGKDLETLRFFTTVGLIDGDGNPKPALETWDSYHR